MSKRKLKTLNLEDKINLINDVDRNPNMKKKDIALKYGIPPNTLSTILKERENILKRYESSNPLSKRLKMCAFPELESALLKWFQQYRNRENAIPISGVLLREKAIDFAKLLKIDNFHASAGWLEKFKSRHNIVFRTLHGEAKAVPLEVCEQWLNETLPNLLQGYSENDVFNIDEMGLFFKCLPNKTMMFKDENCSGGKMSKERLTVLVGGNASGKEKLPLLVIGKYRNPRCFKNVKTYPVEYKSNKKSWMTSVIFEDYVRKLDRKFFAKKRKVILFMDKCTAHSDLPNLKTINLQFLPPNTTAKLQPMDQGIIKCFKQSYRKRLVRKMIHDIENNISFKVDVLEAMRLLSSAWNNDVSETTIRNCFRKCGFFKETQSEPVIEELVCEEVIENFDFINFDENIAVCGDISDEEFIQITEENDESAAEEEGSETIVPNILEARASLDVLQKFLESREGMDNSMFVHLQKIEDLLFLETQKGLLQRKLTDYFKKK